MSLTDICHEVDRWPPEQRRELARHLKILELINGPEYMVEIGRRIDAMQAGDCVTREELMAHLEKRGIALT